MYQASRARKFVVSLLLLGLLPLALGACQPPPATSAPTSVPAPTAFAAPTTAPGADTKPNPPAATPQAAITDGGTLIFATNLTAEFPINPIIAQNRPALWMFDPLLELDAKTGVPAPALAESWIVSSDNKVYTFKLRRNVKWHDGAPFTADDVVFTFNMWLNDPASLYKSNFTYGKDSAGNARLASIKKIDDFTVEITLPDVSASFLENLTGWHGIAPKHLLDGQSMANAAFNQKPIGTGVLKFVELKSKQYVKFSMTKEYWRGKPHLDGFIWQIIPDNDAQVTALANKEIDVIKNVVSDDMAAKIEKTPGSTIYNALGNFTWALFLNHKLKIFQDQAVREAIAMAINKPALVKGTVGKNIIPADQLLNPSHWGYNPDVRVIPFDVEKSKATLKQAGWADSNNDGVLDKDGQPLAFTAITEIVNDATAAGIQDYLKAVGIKMSIKQVERAVRTDLQKTGNWEAFTGYDGAAIPTGIYASNYQSGVWTGYANPAVDQLIMQADRATDLPQRATAVKQIEKILTDQTATIWLYYYNSAIAVSNNIAGLQTPPTTADQNNTGVFYHLEDLYMKTPK